MEQFQTPGSNVFYINLDLSMMFTCWILVVPKGNWRFIWSFELRPVIQFHWVFFIMCKVIYLHNAENKLMQNNKKCQNIFNVISFYTYVLVKNAYNKTFYRQTKLFFFVFKITSFLQHCNDVNGSDQSFKPTSIFICGQDEGV